MKRVAREVLVRVRRAGDEGSAEEESSDGDESSDSDTPDKKARGSRKVARRKRETPQDVRPSKPSRAETRRVAMRAAAAEATAVGVCQDVAESLAEARLTSRALADDAAAAARRVRRRRRRRSPRIARRGARSARAAAARARAFLGRGGRRVRASAPGRARDHVHAGRRRAGGVPGGALGPPRRRPRSPSVTRVQAQARPARGARRTGRGLSRDGEAPRRERRAADAGGLVATAVPPRRAGGRRRRPRRRASAAADAAAASAAARNVRCAVGCVTLRHLPESAFSSPSHYDEDREDDEPRSRARQVEARDRRGSIGAAPRAARGATAESIAEWARRARDKGLVPVADPGSNVSEAAGETSVTTHRHRPVQGSRPAPSSEGAFNSVFRPRAEREAPRPDPPLSAETETTPGKTPRATQTQTQTQLLGRFVRAQRACARAELVTARAFRERRDARLSARRLHDVADAACRPRRRREPPRREPRARRAWPPFAEGGAKSRRACGGPRAPSRSSARGHLAPRRARLEIDAFRSDPPGARSPRRARPPPPPPTRSPPRSTRRRARAAAAAHGRAGCVFCAPRCATSRCRAPVGRPARVDAPVDAIDGAFRDERDALLAATAASLAARAQFERAGASRPWPPRARKTRRARARRRAGARPTRARDTPRRRPWRRWTPGTGSRRPATTPPRRPRGGDERGMRRRALAARRRRRRTWPGAPSGRRAGARGGLRCVPRARLRRRTQAHAPPRSGARAGEPRPRAGSRGGVRRRRRRGGAPSGRAFGPEARVRRAVVVATRALSGAEKTKRAHEPSRARARARAAAELASSRRTTPPPRRKRRASTARAWRRAPRASRRRSGPRRRRFDPPRGTRICENAAARTAATAIQTKTIKTKTGSVRETPSAWTTRAFRSPTTKRAPRRWHPPRRWTRRSPPPRRRATSPARPPRARARWTPRASKDAADCALADAARRRDAECADARSPASSRLGKPQPFVAGGDFQPAAETAAAFYVRATRRWRRGPWRRPAERPRDGGRGGGRGGRGGVRRRPDAPCVARSSARRRAPPRPSAREGTSARRRRWRRRPGERARVGLGDAVERCATRAARWTRRARRGRRGARSEPTREPRGGS